MDRGIHRWALNASDKRLLFKNPGFGIFKSRDSAIKRWEENGDVRIQIARIDGSGNMVTKWIEVIW